MTVLEVGSGASTNIPCAMTVNDHTSKYITANMNKKLTQGLRNNTSNLPVKIKIIEDNADNIKNYLNADSVDAIVFEHSVNDVLQAILCENKGIDTTNNDWFEILPEMIKMISEDYVNRTLEHKTKTAFLSLINNCLSVLKPSGYLAMSHYMFQYDLDLGYNAELWENILPVIRPWLKELPIGKEVFVDEFDPQWWLFYQK
jgi:predicted SAM-dependent methyltransferase